MLKCLNVILSLKSRTMSNIHRIIEEDRKKYPNCSYSYSSSRTCNNSSSDDDDNVICKVVEQITRSCPNAAPRIIYSVDKTDTQKGHIIDIPQDDIFHSSSSEFFPHMNSIFRNFFNHDKLIEDFFLPGEDRQRQEREKHYRGRPRISEKKSALPFDAEVVGPSETI